MKSLGATISIRLAVTGLLPPVLACMTITASASDLFDPINQPIGTVGAYAITKRGLADGETKLFRPYFNDVLWWGDLESFDLAADGAILDANGQEMTSTTVSYVPNWSANEQLDGMDFEDRRILTRRDDTGAAVLFEDIDDLSDAQQDSLESQDILDYLRGDRSNESVDPDYRVRATILGDIIGSDPLYVEYDEDDLSENRLYVGANDGMLHAFNADTGDEEFAYIPSEVVPNLHNLSSTGYYDDHRFFVDGKLVADDVTFADDTEHKILVGGLGAGGQAYYALDITDQDVVSDLDLRSRLLWEISDRSTGMSNLGYSYSRPLLAEVNGPDGPVWAVIFGNGYSNVLGDVAEGDIVGTGTASLFIVNAETGALIKEINTGAGSLLSPNGLSSPSAADLDEDDVVDFVYAGDLDGNIWRFDLTGSVADWEVSFEGSPFTTLVGPLGDSQPVTVAPYLLRHPDGGVLLVAATGRMLSTADTSSTQVQSVYGLRDRLDGATVTIDTDEDDGNIVVQTFIEGEYSTGEKILGVRSSTNYAIGDTMDGWVVDLISGERVLTDLKIRSGQILFSSINPTLLDPSDPTNQRGGEVWVNEINFLTGGAPRQINYDMDDDGDLTYFDNVDGNGDEDRSDPEDRITAVNQGYGVVVSYPTLAVLDANTGIYYLNRLNHSIDEIPPPVPEAGGPGLAGGHFDVDTASFIAEVDGGSTDGHVHEYDDSYDVTGVDYFSFHTDKLHEIYDDIEDDQQKFKIIVVNADESPGGRLVINQSYDEADDDSYYDVTEYDDTSTGALQVYQLGALDAEDEDTLQLTQFGLYFDVNAIIDGGLFPTQTGCVRKNTPSYDGDWRNSALTVWAVKVEDDGSDAFVLETNGDGKVVGITEGLLWESTLFWHWKGPCAHEYESLDADFVDKDGEPIINPDTGESYSVFEYYASASIKEEDKKDKKKDKRGKDKDKKKDKDKSKGKGKDEEDTGDSGGDPDGAGDGGIIDLPDAENAVILETQSPPGWLGNPFRVSWGEL